MSCEPAEMAEMVYDCLLSETSDLIGGEEWAMAKLPKLAQAQKDIRANMVYMLVSSQDAYCGSTRCWNISWMFHNKECQDALSGNAYSPKAFYYRVKVNGEMAEAFILGFNCYSNEPLFLETFEDLLIRVFRLDESCLPNKQAIIASNVFHPDSPIPQWTGANAALPCNMGP